MNSEVYASYLRAIGHKVIQTDSAYWYDVYPRTFLAFPYQRPIDPGAAEKRELFRSALMLRFVAAAGGVDSYYIACDQKPYGLATLSSKARNQTRRGLENWQVEEVECNWLAEHGAALNAETLARQGRRESDFDSNRWRRVCAAAAKYPGFEAWRAQQKDSTGAVALTFLMDDIAFILLQRSSYSNLNSYPNNALTFEVTQRMLARSNVRAVFYGLRALAATESLDHFKTGMGYREFPIRESFVAAPILRPWAPALRFAIARVPLLRSRESLKKLGAALTYCGESRH